MKFTLAIISYNAQNVIRKSLESCINQTYKDLDIVVVDDNSSDDTVSIIKEYQEKDKRINIIQHDTNKSALQARKMAIKHAKSKYIWFIDSDDHIELSAVGELSRALEANNMPDMLTFGSNDYLENGVLKRVFFDWGMNKSLAEWKHDSDYRPYTRVTKREILEQAVNLIPDDLYLYRHNDFFMFNLIKLFVQTKAILKRPLYNYTLSSNSVTNQKDKQSISRHIELLDKLLNQYEKVATEAQQQDVNVAEFVGKEKNKLIKYAISQYKDNPATYLHTLKQLNNYQRDIVISLTTYSKRIKTVHKTISSLLNQSILVDKIILWLDEEEIQHSELPRELAILESDVFEVKFCPNYKSYKKLIPTLAFSPDATIITFDDDIEYPIDQVEKLVLAHFDNPEEVITSVARNILIKDGELRPYSEWLHVFKEQVGKPLLHLLPIGVGGVLYPSGSLHSEVMNIDAFMELAPHGDDLWFKAMTLLNDRKVIALNHGYNLSPNMIEGTQDVGLWQTTNEDTDSNYVQLNCIIEHYNLVKIKIMAPEFSQTPLDNLELSKILQTLNSLKIGEGKLKKEVKALKEKLENSDMKAVQIERYKETMVVSFNDRQFDETWYLKTYPDVAKSGIPPIEHFKKFGKLLNRKPNNNSFNHR
ncbi:glycosyltransferase family 2 protein [Aeromonas veronii]